MMPLYGSSPPAAPVRRVAEAFCAGVTGQRLTWAGG